VTTRNIIRIVILAGVVAYFAYAHFAGKHNDEAKPTLAAPIAANAKEFTLGTLDFKACDIKQKHSGATTSAFCAPFSVPENRDDANGRKIDLRLALIKSDAATADADIVVYLAGGPGQSAVDTWPQVTGSFAPLRKHHHILLLDQRGTGESNPLTCKHADDETDSGEEFDAAKAAQRIHACLDEVSKKADPRFYTTTIAADDLEAARAALGNPMFDLVGVSYGTRMAQQYAMRHPDGVRSIVLDSVAPNELALGQDFAANLENALKAQFAACTNTPACQKAFGDSYANLFALRDQLRANPRDFEYHNPTTFKTDKKRLNQYALTGLVRMFAYTPETAALLPLSISQGLHGDFTPLLGQTELLKGDLADLTDNGMQMSVICSEDADLIAPRAEDDKTLLGNLMIQSLQSMCSVWPHGTRPSDFHAPLKTDKPVLVLEGELDPVTPPAYGEQVMKNFSNAKLIVAKGQGHNVIGRGCIPKVVEDFVDNLKPKDLDVKCVDMLGPTPAFIDFNGAAP
jgi:pimeloyl-ACP methyl ester carboxylesterase